MSGAPHRLLGDSSVAREQPGSQPNRKSLGDAARQGQQDGTGHHGRRWAGKAAEKGMGQHPAPGMVAGMPYQTHDCIANMDDHIREETGKRNIAFSLDTGYKCRVRLIMRHPVPTYLCTDDSRDTVTSPSPGSAGMSRMRYSTGADPISSFRADDAQRKRRDKQLHQPPTETWLYTGWSIKNAPSFEGYHFRKVIDKHLRLWTLVEQSILRQPKHDSFQSSERFKNRAEICKRL